MKRKLYLIIFFIAFSMLSLTSYAQIYKFDWVNNPQMLINDVASDPNGGIYIVGLFQNTINIGEYTLNSYGMQDVLVAKLDDSGNYIWAINAGGTSTDVAESVACDGDGNVYVLGTFKSTATFGDTTLTALGKLDMFVSKIDKNGNFIWSVRAGGSDYDFANSIITDDNGNPYITGFFKGMANFGDSTFSSMAYFDGIVSKLDKSGTFIWTKRFGGIGGAIVCSSVAITNNDNDIYVIGDFSGSLICGNDTLLCTDLGDIFIAKLNELNEFQWVIQTKGEGFDEGNFITSDKSGNIYAMGRFEKTCELENIVLESVGEEDVFITKVDTSGHFLWISQIKGTTSDYGYSLATDVNNSIFSTGYFGGSADFGDTVLISSGVSDIYITQLDQEGHFQWARQISGMSNGNDAGYSIVTDKNGNIFLTGVVWGMAEFDGHTVDGGSFIGKMSEAANIINTENSRSKLDAYVSNKKLFIHTSDRFINSECKLIDIKGHIVYSTKISGTDFESETLDIPAGIYLVRIMSNERLLTKKILVN